MHKPFQQQAPHGSAKRAPRLGMRQMGKTLGRIAGYLAAYKVRLTLILLFILLSACLGLMGPYLLGVTIDRYLGDTSRSGLLGLIAVLAGVYVLHSLSNWLQNYWMIGVAQQVVYTMRAELFQHLHRLPVSYFAKRQHGELMSRVTNDMDNVSSTLNSSFIQLVFSVLTFFGMIGLMLWLSPLLTFITLLIIPVMFLGMKWITARTGKYFRDQQRNMGELNGFVEETLSGQSIVKVFSREEAAIQAFDEKAERLRASGYWAQTYSGFIPKLMNMLNNMSFAVIAAAGGMLALRDVVTVGIIVTFAEYARQFTRPLNDLANQYNTFLAAVAGADRVFEVMDERSEAWDESSGALPMESVQGAVAFEKVSFAYTPGQPTLSEVSFEVLPGQTAALVGPTGAGKSTIVQLLTRFYEADAGRITIDGREIRTIQRASLRRQMGYVLQDTFLFQGSIRENIRYGRLEASDAEVVEAAKLANAHSFIMKLPEGYDTQLHQDGSGISQGQKQLLAIARAMLADPAILLLDEATSSIDTVTEINIQEALGRLMKNRTSIVVAHRLNTIQRADLILVIDEGKVIERGTHRELLEKQGKYAQLVHSQVNAE